jgi:Kef-type K+ transport system membrane component KefB
MPTLPLAPDGLPAPPESEGHLALLLLGLAALLVVTRVLGDLAGRLRQPAVLGELVAGLLLGPSLLGLLDPTDPVITFLAELGVLILLFEIGLHTDLKAILRVGASATAVGLAGVVLPLVGGLVAMRALGVSGITAVVCGAALTATSIGISARVLSDLNQLETDEGRIVLGAAVLDDVIGLVILSVVTGLAGGGVLTAAGVGRTAAIAVGFLVVALLAGRLLAPRLVRLIARLRGAGATAGIALAFALALAGAADLAGSAMIVGAFAAGLVLYATPPRLEIEKAITGLGHFFVPVFFASVGAAIDLAFLTDRRVLLLGGVLIGIAVLGKLAAGFAPWWFRGHRLLIGVAMIPRGEVGLIFATMGAATGALDDGLFSAVVLMVMVTTFVTPPWLARLTKVAGKPPRDRSGLSELVSGRDLD